MLALMTPSSVYPAASEVQSRSRSASRKSTSLSSSSRTAGTGTPASSSQTMTRAPPNRPLSPQPSSAIRFSHPQSPSAAAPEIDIDEDDEIDVHAIPPQDLLKMLASLLTQIAQQNDSIVPHTDSEASSASLPAPPSSPHKSSLVPPNLTTASRIALESPQSMLTFHARNIPTITLEAYLLRILKYCPTTNEVFLALLVYFERMGKLSREVTDALSVQKASPENLKRRSLPEGLVIDSYNVHRLVIAGVTVASKFFSDVFYTNSRYAKVGGLPQAELNQLELQFLLLNNFHLAIPHDEMQRYARELVRFAQRQDPSTPVAIVAVKKASKAINLVGSGGQTPPSSSQLQKQQEMGAIDAYGGSFPTSIASQPPSSKSTDEQLKAQSKVGVSTMVSHPFLPSVSTTSGHPFLPSNSPTTPQRPSSSASWTSTNSHFLQPGAHSFEQKPRHSYDEASSSQPLPSSHSQKHDATFMSADQRPRLASTSSAASDASSLFSRDSESGDAETDGDGSTEDEPTIRPNGQRSERASICSFASSSTTSLYSDYGDSKSGSEIEMSDAGDNEGGKTPETNAEREGERTPETASVDGGAPEDSQMASP